MLQTILKLKLKAPFGYDRVVNATIQMYHSDWEALQATAAEENWYPANLYYDGL